MIYNLIKRDHGDGKKWEMGGGLLAEVLYSKKVLASTHKSIEI